MPQLSFLCSHQIGFLREVKPLPGLKGIAECLLLEHSSPVLGQRMACKEQYILRGKREGTHRHVPGLVTAFLFETGRWQDGYRISVTGCQDTIKSPGSLGPTLLTWQARGPEIVN